MNSTEIDALLEEHSKVMQENQEYRECLAKVSESITEILNGIDISDMNLKKNLYDCNVPQRIVDLLTLLVEASTVTVRTELKCLKSIISKATHEMEHENEIKRVL